MYKKTVVIFLMFLVTSLRAQDNPGITDELAPRSFYLDYTAFADTVPGTIVLEVYYKIYSSRLTYQKWGDKFKADYGVDIIISKKGKQITGASNDGNLTADDYKSTYSRSDFIINKVLFRLPPDNYELSGRLRDSNSGDIMSLKKINLKLKDFGARYPFLSSIEFIRDSRPAENDSQFVKSGVWMLPSVSRMFGDDEPVMSLYYEIYNNSDFIGDYVAVYNILNGSKLVSSDTALFPSDGARTCHLEKLKVDTLPAGEYEISMMLKSPGKKMELKAEEKFLISWSVIGLVKNDFKTAIEQLRYIAAREQMKKLFEAPVADHIRTWEEFWKSQDPTPGTPENERKDEYYKRLRYAELNFGNFGRNGWKTDMGMVYITYGPPDEIERHPFDLDSKPYQIWSYYILKRVFRFVDVNGYGEFELMYPYDGDPRKLR